MLSLKNISIFIWLLFSIYHMTIVSISHHGRITIPSEIRKKYGWKDGDKVMIIDHPSFILRHDLIHFFTLMIK